MLEKLRDNPRAVVAALIAAGIVAVAIGASGQNNDEAVTDQQETAIPETLVDGEGASTEEGAETVDEATSEEPSEPAPEPAAGPVEVSSDEGVLRATVRTGDNQTVIVRQMVDEYLSANSETISEEQKLFVETHAVNGLPRDDIIEAGEEVSVEESVIAQLVEDSKQLDDAAINRWSAYL